MKHEGNYFVYILETVDNTLYCGVAKDVLKRFDEHKNGLGAKYTKAHKPLMLVYVEIFKSKNDALKEEYRIKKTLSRKQKLELVEEHKEKTEIILNSMSWKTKIVVYNKYIGEAPKKRNFSEASLSTLWLKFKCYYEQC